MDKRAGFGLVGWDQLMVGLDQLISGFESVGGSVGLIVGSSYGDFFFFEWVCFWFWFWFDGGGIALGWWLRW